MGLVEVSREPLLGWNVLLLLLGARLADSCVDSFPQSSEGFARDDQGRVCDPVATWASLFKAAGLGRWVWGTFRRLSSQTSAVSAEKCGEKSRSFPEKPTIIIDYRVVTHCWTFNETGTERYGAR